MSNHKGWDTASPDKVVSSIMLEIDMQNRPLNEVRYRKKGDGGWYLYLANCPHRFTIKDQVLAWTIGDIPENLAVLLNKHYEDDCAKLVKSAGKGKASKTKSIKTKAKKKPVQSAADMLSAALNANLKRRLRTAQKIKTKRP